MQAFQLLLSVAALTSVAFAYPAKQGQTSGSAWSNKLTVYWGAEDDTTTLSDVCSDASYNIVNLAFVDYFKGNGGYPSMSLSTLGGPSEAQQEAGATSLQDGSSLVPAIQACQSSGKLVIMSLGGAVGYADVTLSGDSQAIEIADTLWSLFGGGTNETITPLRPFGNVTLDGFDIGKILSSK